MSSLILDLQKKSTDSSVPITDLLRLALIASKKLKIKEFEKWVENELNGYHSIDDLPSYRRVFGQPKARNPYNGWIPIMFKDQGTMDMISNMPLSQPIAAIEESAKTKEFSLYLSYSNSAQQALMEILQTDMQPALVIATSAIRSIMDAVRNKVLNWALDLEKEGILGEGMTFTDKEREKADNIHPTYNITNNIENMTNSPLQQNTSHSNQTINIQELNMDLVKSFIELIISNQADLKLDAKINEELRSDIETIRLQLSANKPKKTIIGECLNSIRAILQGASGSVAANLLLPTIKGLLGG